MAVFSKKVPQKNLLQANIIDLSLTKENNKKDMFRVQCLLDFATWLKENLIPWKPNPLGAMRPAVAALAARRFLKKCMWWSKTKRCLKWKTWQKTSRNRHLQKHPSRSHRETPWYYVTKTLMFSVKTSIKPARKTSELRAFATFEVAWLLLWTAYGDESCENEELENDLLFLQAESRSCPFFVAFFGSKPTAQ